MTTVGIIGGVAPESTIEYYRLLVQHHRARIGSDAYPSILIDSIDLRRMLDFVAGGDLPGLTEYLAGEVERLARAGADFAVLASNTPHVVFDALRARVSVPMISIVEASCEAADALGLRRVGLLGTRFTMQGRFYPDVFARRGISLVTPQPEEQAYVHDKYMGELVGGSFLDETRERLLAIVARMKERDGVDGLILGGTELPLLLRVDRHEDIPFLDTTRIHVGSILDRLIPGTR